MSLFLIYTEFGKSSSFEINSDQLKVLPIALRDSSRQASTRRAFVITDGLASDIFLQFGKHVAGRKGELLRSVLQEFFRSRLHGNVIPCFSFLIIHNKLDEVSLPLENRKQIQLERIPDLFKSIKPTEIYEVIG